MDVPSDLARARGKFAGPTAHRRVRSPVIGLGRVVVFPVPRKVGRPRAPAGESPSDVVRLTCSQSLYNVFWHLFYNGF